MRRLIVDGFNVLHALDRYADVLARDLTAATDRLVDDVASFAAGGWQATVVFDGAGRRGAPDTVAARGGVDVVFTLSGVEADTVVESLARSARDAGEEAVVVTSDASTRWTVIGGGIGLLSAKAFGEALSEDAAERSEHGRGGSGRCTVDARIDAETRTALLRLLDSQE